MMKRVVSEVGVGAARGLRERSVEHVGEEGVDDENAREREREREKPWVEGRRRAVELVIRGLREMGERAGMGEEEVEWALGRALLSGEREGQTDGRLSSQTDVA